MRAPGRSTKYIKVAENIWVGALPSGNDLDSNFLVTSGVNVVIALNLKINRKDIEIIEYALPSGEMLDSEIPKTRAKLAEICEEIHDLRETGLNVLIACSDGKNKAMLVAGYYLINYGRMQPQNVINFLEFIHFTDKERVDESRDAELLQRSIDTEIPVNFSQDVRRAQDERRELKCLTMISFKRALLWDTVHKRK